jgi:hypothetical protein
MNAELWEAGNGVLAILGFFVVTLVAAYLLRNIRRTYHEPVRLITLAFAAVILGHTIKDSAAYLARCCGYAIPDWWFVLALALIGLGKLGCIRIWSKPSWGYWPWIAALAAACGFLAFNAAQAQEHHARGHTFYQNWVNQAGTGCCNDQDCGTLAEENQREVAGHVEVKIDGTWCPVEPRHYLKTGNAPDWSSAHVCVRKVTGLNLSACERLLCYQPKPGI